MPSFHHHNHHHCYNYYTANTALLLILLLPPHNRHHNRPPPLPLPQILLLAVPLNTQASRMSLAHLDGLLARNPTHHRSYVVDLRRAVSGADSNKNVRAKVEAVQMSIRVYMRASSWDGGVERGWLITSYLHGLDEGYEDGRGAAIFCGSPLERYTPPNS